MAYEHEDEIASRKHVDLTVAELKLKRVTHEPFWRDVDEHICPGAYRGQLTDADRGERKDDSLLDSTPTQAWNDHKAGFISYATSPGWPWIKFKTEDPDLAEYGPVAQFNDDVAATMLAIFEEESNLYEALESFYGYRGAFGNGLIFVEENPKTVLHARSLPVGSWWVGVDYWGEVTVFYREFRTTAGSAVKTFGKRTRSGGYDMSNFSTRIRTAYEKGRYQETVDVGHIVMPNEGWNPKYVDAREKEFKSCYFELAGPQGDTSERERMYLSEGGYDDFPALFCPWDVIGEDAYGYACPGRTALGDCKELQYNEGEITKAVAKANDPPTYGSAFWGQASKKIGYLPGQYTPVPAEVMQGGGIKQLHEFTPQVLQMDVRQDAKRRRIERSFHVDTFRMLDYLEERQRTATEIAARQDERMRRLIGPTNRLHRRMLGPITERAFKYMHSQGRLPPIPDELIGQRVKVEYVSVMAQSMRSLGIAAIERVLGVFNSIAEFVPSAGDKINFDQCLDETAKGAGAPARIMNDDETAEAKRQERAKQQAALQQAEMMERMTKGVKTLADAKTEDRSVLTDVAKAVTKGAA